MTRASDAPDPQQLARAIEEILGELAAAGEGPARAGEELVRVLMQFYGAGLEAAVSVVRVAGGDDLVHRLGADPLVSALLALHDLHPVDLPTRVGHALDTARRRLGSHGTGIALERLELDTGAVHVRLGSGCGGGETVRDVVRTAVGELAPEIAVVEFTTEPAGPAFVQIGMRPPELAAGS
ncbi:NifU family protein [Actinomycetospora endophytica]|uniref:NifU family protein n=1 Tax=Actinomycetospora endophytica TaxID=2291215 RepID=A0ABS8P3L6_9PSEU|nr:NifU family protein [Actinomycetospora endophytica]MCD2192840.1 NifU family protein [Actinomycetospora endophytica]